ncbi:DUF4190 domain-containing protein [Agrococcus sp. KRD186]|jgi:hypothetical protein|uniref:DUF4190 domain-containing protein n=1 Tax=Agrococcus sp. KRD186 TaxID=2729730 RepID=UPI001F49D718|nr:hypothetical protein [Agrococcus sp. KRD186]
MSDYQSPYQPGAPAERLQPGGYASAEPKTLSIVSLAIGIVSLFLGFTFLIPIAGLIVGIMAKGREPAGRTMANWGIALNIVALVLGLLLVLLFGGIVLAALGMAGFAA